MGHGLGQCLSISYVVIAGTKRHLQPIDAFSGLLMRPKCICGRGSARTPLGSWEPLPKNPRSWPSALNFGPLGLRSAPPRQIPGYAAVEMKGMDEKGNRKEWRKEEGKAGKEREAKDGRREGG